MQHKGTTDNATQRIASQQNATFRRRFIISSSFDVASSSFRRRFVISPSSHRRRFVVASSHRRRVVVASLLICLRFVVA